MFKPLSLLIHKTPWWALLLGGIAGLLILVMFTVPMQVLQLSHRGGTPQEQRAIQHEINQAFKDSGLSVAEGIVTTMKDRAQDPERRRELERALIEIARARDDVSHAGSEAEQLVRDAAQEALDAAQESAQGALEAAQEARQAVQESKDQAMETLKEKGLDVSATQRSFDDLLKGAKEKEAAAQATLDGIAKSREKLQQSPPKRGDVTVNSKFPPASPGAPSVRIDVPTPPAVPVSPLPAELRDSIRHTVVGDMWRVGLGSALILAFIPLFVTLLIAKFFIDRSHRALAFAQQKTEEAQFSDMRRQMTEARLQALQAQVEPHFLYNTLANVQALTEVDPPAANKLVGHLIEYLRAALPKMRESSSTVGQEVERVRAYLNILKMRMGERLDFGIQVPEGLLNLAFPPMMLPTLVENAIKHGLEPRREGGRIDVLATSVQRGGRERLVLKVADTGAGLSEQETQSGSGVGLSNLRERLLALYGDKASFTIEANQSSGVVATIDIPADAQTATTAVQPLLQRGPFQPAGAQPVLTGLRRVWGVTRKTHGVWAQLMSRTFVILMMVLLVGFFVALIGLFTGWLPVQINEFRFDGVEGMALGSLGLLLAFGVMALVVGILLLLLYGLGFLFAGLLIFVPAVILVSLFPALSPFILVGLGVYWFWWRKRKNRQTNSSNSVNNKSV
jgi:hypothetical protein